MKLYIKRLGVEKLDIKIDDFTKKLFYQINKEYDSPTVGITFLDTEFKKKQCKTEGRRSIDDLICIYRTYLGSIHIKSILLSMERIVLSPKKAGILFCPDINKWVLHNYYSYTARPYIYMRKYCEYGEEHYDKTGDGTISLKFILDTLGFKNHKI